MPSHKDKLDEIGGIMLATGRADHANTLALAARVIEAAEYLCGLRGDVTKGDRFALNALLAEWNGDGE